MRNSIIYLCYICVLLSGCGNRNNQNTGKNGILLFHENDDADSQQSEIDDQLYFLDFEANLKNIQEDTFTINSIAKNITFIPLETSDSVLLYNDVIQIQKINEGYLISTSSFLTNFHYIMVFDTTGRFKNYLMKRGQGPKELPYISEWSYNHHTQLLVASTWHQIIIHFFENNTSNKYLLDVFFMNACLLNDGTIVGLPSALGKGDTETPYLHFLNQEGKIVRSICYPQKRNIAYDFSEGRTIAYGENYGLYPSYSGDALFKDMFNDTIYRIRNMDDVQPYMILHKGSLTPTLKDIYNSTTAAQKVKLSQILDTKKYFIIVYGYRGKTYTSVWDKKTRTLIANTIHPPRMSRLTSFNGFTNYRTPTGKEIQIMISSYFDGKLFGVLDATQAMEFLPNIKEDDNPVLTIIEL